MEIDAAMEAPASADRVFAIVEDLTGYPRWMPLAHRVSAPTTDDDGRPAWDVEIRARLGPLARSKRLRMVRTGHDPHGHRVRFERRELDGRRHAAWVLDAHVVSLAESSSRLEMHLHYGGALWGGGLMERVLADQIESGRERLLALLTTE